jgi:Spy/CpxP family protein refolding chaperone
MGKILLCLLLTVVFALPASAQTRDMPMKEQREGHGQMMGLCGTDDVVIMMGMCIEHTEFMGLTNAQIMKIKHIQIEVLKKQARFKADLQIAEIELMEFMEVKDFDMAKASSAVKKIVEVKAAHYLEMLKTAQEMRAVLTEEQFEKMKVFQQNLLLIGER